MSNIYLFSWIDKHGHKVENQAYTVGNIDKLMKSLEEWGCTNIKMQQMDDKIVVHTHIADNEEIAEKLYEYSEDMDAMDYCDSKDEEIELIKNSLDEIMGEHTALYEAIKRCVGV